MSNWNKIKLWLKDWLLSLFYFVILAALVALFWWLDKVRFVIHC